METRFEKKKVPLLGYSSNWCLTRFLLLRSFSGESENLHLLKQQQQQLQQQHGSGLHLHNKREAGPYTTSGSGYGYDSSSGPSSGTSSVGGQRNRDRAEPYFRTQGQTYKIKVGDSVKMLCNVENLGKRTKKCKTTYVLVHMVMLKFVSCSFISLWKETPAKFVYISWKGC